jgi:hypothetical protein
MTQVLYSLKRNIEIDTTFWKILLNKNVKSVQNSDKNTDTGTGIYGKQEVSSVWCENARTNDGENPEITIAKSEV